MTAKKLTLTNLAALLIYITLTFILIFSNLSNSFARNISSTRINSKSNSNFIIARVNNKVITYLELIDRYKFVLYTSKIKVKSSKDKKMILTQIIDKMIDEELIRQEAVKLKIEISPEEVKKTLDEVASQQKKSTKKFNYSLIKRNISVENYVKQIESDLIWSKIISAILRAKVKITDAEIQEFFEQQKFDTNVTRLHIAGIFIPTNRNLGNKSLEISTKLVSELRNGADFNNIVRQFSRDSLTVENNGEIGWFSAKDLDQKIYKEISQLKKGEYSNPVLLDRGYYIYKLLDRKTETKIEDRDMNIARGNIFMKKLQNLAKGYLMDLKKKSFVEVNRSKLNKIH